MLKCKLAVERMQEVTKPPWGTVELGKHNEPSDCGGYKVFYHCQWPTHRGERQSSYVNL